MKRSRIDEGFMDTMKSGWKKIKKAFSDLPEVQLVGDNGQKEIGYLHDINLRKGTCTFMLPNDVNESAVAAAVAAGLAMRGGKGENKGGERRKPKEFKPKFSKGEKATLVGAEEDLGSNKIPVEIEGVDNCGSTYMYFLKLIETHKEKVNEMRKTMKEGTETNPRFKCMEDGAEDEDTQFLIEVIDEEGHFDEFMIDLADESDWGNINTVDGTCYFPSGEEFDGIGWGNDEDGYLRIGAVWKNRYQDDEEEISTREFAKIVDSLAGLYSDM